MFSNPSSGVLARLAKMQRGPLPETEMMEACFFCFGRFQGCLQVDVKPLNWCVWDEVFFFKRGPIILGKSHLFL